MLYCSVLLLNEWSLHYTMLPKLGILLGKAEHWSPWLVLCIKLDFTRISWVVRICKAITSRSDADQITNLSHLIHRMVLGLVLGQFRVLYMSTALVIAVLAKVEGEW